MRRAPGKRPELAEALFLPCGAVQKKQAPVRRRIDGNAAVRGGSGRTRTRRSGWRTSERDLLDP